MGMARSEKGLKDSINQIRALREEFWQNLCVPTNKATLNKSLEMAGRVADCLELAELMALDALNRNESCDGHFRLESQSEEGEARRDDENFTYVAAWEYTGDDKQPILNKEPLVYENVTPSQRSYK